MGADHHRHTTASTVLVDADEFALKEEGSTVMEDPDDIKLGSEDSSVVSVDEEGNDSMVDEDESSMRTLFRTLPNFLPLERTFSARQHDLFNKRIPFPTSGKAEVVYRDDSG